MRPVLGKKSVQANENCSQQSLKITKKNKLKIVLKQ